MSETEGWVGIDPAIDLSRLVSRVEVLNILGIVGPSLRGWERNEHFPAPVLRVVLGDGRRFTWWYRDDIKAFAEIKPELAKQIIKEASRKRVETMRARGDTFVYPKKKPRPPKKDAVKIRVSNLPNVEGEAK